uniref:Uncharacterized protein n=1 Tax=Anser brachyrhynchus TaxID=132585 RepID=A0A8B9C6W2_9AVES
LLIPETAHGAGPASPPPTHLQPHVEHHGGDDVEVREVDAELPGQVEEDEEGPGQPLAEHAVRPGSPGFSVRTTKA